MRRKACDVGTSLAEVSICPRAGGNRCDRPQPLGIIVCLSVCLRAYKGAARPWRLRHGCPSPGWSAGTADPRRAQRLLPGVCCVFCDLD